MHRCDVGSLKQKELSRLAVHLGVTSSIYKTAKSVGKLRADIKEKWDAQKSIHGNRIEVTVPPPPAQLETLAQSSSAK